MSHDILVDSLSHVSFVDTDVSYYLNDTLDDKIN